MNLSIYNHATRSSPLTYLRRGGNRLTLGMALFALLPLFLLLYAVQETHQASVESADVNQAGSLRFRSLLAYEVVSKQQPNTRWRPILATMAAIRASLRTRHPQAVAQTDVAWNAFSGSFQRSGRVDWPMALRMRDVADRLTQSVEDTARRRHDHATGLFLAGIAATIAFIGLALFGARNNRRTEQARVQSEETLRQRDAHLQGIVATAVDGIITIDERGTIQSFNPAAARMFGYTVAEVMGRNISLLMPEPYASEHDSHLAHHLQTGERKIIGTGREVRGKRKDGSVFPLDVAVSSIQQGDHQIFVGIVRDTTERNATEERFRVLFEQSSDAHLLFDDTGIIDCNHAAVQMLRCRDKAKVLALHPAVLSPEFQPDGRPSLEKCMEMDSIAREQGYHRFEWLHRKMDGECFPVEVTLTPVTIVGKATLLVVWHDLTERKRAEEQVHLLSTVAAESVNGIVITDPQQRIVFVNPAFERLTSYSLEELRGRCPGEVLQGPETDKETKRRIREAIAASQPVSAELFNYHKNGTPYWIEMHITPVLDAQGKVIHFIAVETNITERKQTEMALRKSQEQLTLAQHVAQMGSWEYDLVTGKIGWSPEMFRLLEVDPEQGEPDYVTNLALYHPDDAALLDASVQQAVAEGKDYELDLRQAEKEGQPTRWYHAAGKAVLDATGQVVQLVGTLTDITEQKWLNMQLEQNLALVQDQNVELEWQQQELASANANLEAANEALSELATTDGLTGAKNHRAFQEKLRDEFNRVGRTHRPFSVILLDVDRFKSYNDTYGHPEGDLVLKQVVQVLRATARETDFVARYGGEEFIILLLETGVEGAIKAAERFRIALEAQAWPQRPVTASFGVATLSVTVETGTQLVDMADKALYASKEAGRNCVTHADAVFSLR